MQWIKLHTEVVKDPKMGRLSDRHWRRSIELFAIAGEMEEFDGTLPSIEDMSWILHLSAEELLEDLKALAAKPNQIVEQLEDGSWKVINFIKRQGSNDPTARERQKRYRERHQEPLRNASRNGVTSDVTLRVDIESESDSESEKEEEIDAAAASNAPKSKKRKIGGGNGFDPLSKIFIQETNIPIFTGGKEKWEAALAEMKTAGVIPKDISIAIDELREKGMDKWQNLSSIVGPAISVMARRKSTDQGKTGERDSEFARQKYKDWERAMR